MSWAVNYYLDTNQKRLIQAADFLGLTTTYNYAKANGVVTVTVIIKQDATEVERYSVNIDYDELIADIDIRIASATANYQKWNGLKTQVEGL